MRLAGVCDYHLFHPNADNRPVCSYWSVSIDNHSFGFFTLVFEAFVCCDELAAGCSPNFSSANKRLIYPVLHTSQSQFRPQNTVFMYRLPVFLCKLSYSWRSQCLLTHLRSCCSNCLPSCFCLFCFSPPLVFMFRMVPLTCFRS